MSESEKVDEQLTDEERAQLELAIEVENYPIAKLLRLHDRYKARVEELEQRVEDEQEQTRAHVQAQMLAEAEVVRLKAAREQDRREMIQERESRRRPPG